MSESVDKIGEKYNRQHTHIDVDIFPSSTNEKWVLYVENECDVVVNKFIDSHYDGICKKFKQIDYTFLYVPRASAQVAKYYAPYLSDGAECLMTHEVLHPIVREANICGSALMIGHTKSNDASIAVDVWYFPKDKSELVDFIKNIVSDYTPKIDPNIRCCNTELITRKKEEDNKRYRITSVIDNYYYGDDYADMKFSGEVMNLLWEVEEKIEKLRQYGVNEIIIGKLLSAKVRLSRIIIEENGRIILPDYDNREIRMTPLVKAVYFLFLRHTDGIVFKHLPDYRAELLEIYSRLTGRSSDEGIRQSIEDVTNPCLNSINEKCARIREAFIKEFDERLAEHYYVMGERGKAKRVKLPRNLVIWKW